MPIMLQRKSVVMKRETPSGCRGELLPYRRSFNLEFHLITFYLSQTLFNPNKTVVKMFVVMYDLRAMPAGHQTFLRQRTFSVPVRRDTISQMSKKPLSHGRTLRYLVHLRWTGWLTASWVYSCWSPLLLTCLVLLIRSLPGSRVPSLGRSTSIGTSACCFPGSPWRWTVVLPMSFSLSQSPLSILHFLRAAEMASDRLWIGHGPWIKSNRYSDSSRQAWSWP